MATAGSEEAVFNMLSASASALTDLQEKGKATVVEIVLTTPAGDAAGSFEMSSGERPRARQRHGRASPTTSSGTSSSDVPGSGFWTLDRGRLGVL